MKSFFRLTMIAFAAVLTLTLAACGPATHVSVGVGVHVPGGWGPYGPYPGGSVWVGSPVYPPYYYPLKPGEDQNREFVRNGGKEEVIFTGVQEFPVELGETSASQPAE